MTPFILVDSFLTNVDTYIRSRPHGVTTQSTPGSITTVVGTAELTICFCLYWTQFPPFTLFTLFLQILQLTFLVFLSRLDSIKRIITENIITLHKATEHLQNNYHGVNMSNWTRLTIHYNICYRYHKYNTLSIKISSVLERRRKKSAYGIRNRKYQSQQC